MEFPHLLPQSQSEHENQGFEEQKIQIKHCYPYVELNNHPPVETAKDLIIQERPKDLLPRIMYDIPYGEYPAQLNNMQTFQSELIVANKKGVNKGKKYRSLYDKYNNPKLHYELVYAKFRNLNPTNFLDSVVDYNPNQFRTFCIGEKSCAFDSNFESGNLLYAYKTKENEYDLLLQNDVNTKGYNQWFYFSFKNQNALYSKFNIVNLVKKKSLFTQGVRPIAYSMKKRKWFNIGNNISYHKSLIYRQNGEYYYTLSFEVSFDELDDTTYFSLTLPYTYTKMVKMITDLQKSIPKNIIFTKRILCYSISNNAIPCLNFQTQTSHRKIVVMARQHPGQTVSSYLMEGFLKELVERPNILAEFELIVIPMVNPDGVIYGNFRTNIGGCDLNRQWANPDRWIHPEIYFLKKYISNLKNVEFVIDFHGHSKKFNSFTYGCHQQDKIKQKLFPYLMSRNVLFSLKDCSYGITPDKLTTARSVVNQMDIINFFTLQTSFYGYEHNVSQYKFNLENLYSLSRTVLESLETFFCQEEQVKKAEMEIGKRLHQFQSWEAIQRYDSGSQSNPSEDQLSLYERRERVMSQRVSKKKKKVKRKKQHSKQKAKQKQKQKSKSRIIVFFNQTTDPNQKEFYRNTLQSQTELNGKKQKNSLIHLTHGLSRSKELNYKSTYNPMLIRERGTMEESESSEEQNQPKQKIVSLVSSNLIHQKMKFLKEDRIERMERKMQQDLISLNKLQESIKVQKPTLDTRRRIKTRQKLQRIMRGKKEKEQVNLCIQNSQKPINTQIFKIQKNKSLVEQYENSQKVGDIGKLIMNNSRKLYRLYQPKKTKNLRPIDKSHSIKKDMVFLSELLRPKMNESNNLVYLNIEDDIQKQLKLKNYLARDKKKPIFEYKLNNS